ncbi:aminotransferase class I/II-fold pyridoxal phosphate-dependent enzyme, partial [Salmonella enterica subsp. enterica serovar Infantis]
YQHGAPWLDALRASLAAKMRYIAQALNGAFPTLNWQAPPSTYRAWIDLRSLCIDDQKLQHTLIHQEKVAIMPGEPSGA